MRAESLKRESNDSHEGGRRFISFSCLDQQLRISLEAPATTPSYGIFCWHCACSGKIIAEFPKVGEVWRVKTRISTS